MVILDSHMLEVSGRILVSPENLFWATNVLTNPLKNKTTYPQAVAHPSIIHILPKTPGMYVHMHVYSPVPTMTPMSKASHGHHNLPFCTYFVTIHNFANSVQFALESFDLQSQLLHLRGLVCDDPGLLSEHVLEIFNFLVNGADRDVGLANRRGGGGGL